MVEMRSLAAALALVLAGALATAPAGAANGSCHTQTLSIEGHSVRATFCVTAVRSERTGAGEVAHVTMTETLVGAGGSLTRTTSKDVLMAGSDGRLSDDVPLAQLGIQKTLHLTFVFRNGGVIPESGLLIPGGVPVI
ncbi:MAG TPA: hypothetical protein VNJ51_14425 [Candidatus Dormibacteraeota bacterium]|nr:hypothetical protein [Candidatus Dormibacteraeota bacterium]